MQAGTLRRSATLAARFWWPTCRRSIFARPLKGRIHCAPKAKPFFPGSYRKELNEMLLDRSGKGAKTAQMARQLTAEAKNKKEAAKAIRDFVAKSIRMAGPSFTELPLSELSAADTTLADGYGHQADQAILLHAMLAGAGFEPEFVLASGLPPIAGITNVAMSLPMPQNFQAPLVRIAVDGVLYYLNDTDQYSQLGSTSY